MAAQRPPHLGLIIREASAGDLAALVEGNTRLAIETEHKVLDAGVLTQGVMTALADPDRLRYWVADIGGQVVGHAAITREWSDWRNGWLWWLQSVYVWPEWRGQSVFRALYQHIHGLAKAADDVIGLRLYVENENTRAQETYQAMGMKPGGYHVYEDLWIELRQR